MHQKKKTMENDDEEKKTVHLQHNVSNLSSNAIRFFSLGKEKKKEFFTQKFCFIFQKNRKCL